MGIKCPKCRTDNPPDSLVCIHCGENLLPLEETRISSSTTFDESKEKITINSIFRGKYKLVEKLGGGAMGVVYKAIDTKLNRPVALKFLLSELTGDSEAKERFIQEAQAASVLEHQNICTIHEIEETDEGQLYIAMSFYSGETLKKKIGRGPLPISASIDFAIQIAQGLSKAHEHGIVHRDIKPANIMITNEDVLKILDFGIAKLSGEAELTRTAAITGTVAYMSPEQAQGENTDNQADIWALGVVLYEMLTGNLPFKGENLQAVIHLILSKSPVPPSELRKEIPEELERIIFKCLKKRKKDRYSSVQPLLSDLKKLKKAMEKENQEKIVERKKIAETRKESERREATVAIAEILGYDEIMERMDTEEAASLLNRVYKIIVSILEKYGGWLDKITANRFMVLFGVPTAVENAPKKAINAAIELRNHLHEFNRQENLSIPLGIRTGIDSGMVIIDQMAAAEKVYSVLGETVDIASQLMDLSSKGKIYAGPGAYRYTKNEFEYKPIKPAALKGRKTSIEIFELLSEKERIYRARLGSERMIYSEMVGRDNELNKLELHVLKLIDGHGSIVNVIGEAGIGKSRLMAELREKDAIKKVAFLKGRALSIGKNLSFHPLIDILKSWARIREDDTQNELARKLEKAIGNIFPEGVEEVFPFIAKPMGVKLTGKYAERVRGIEGEALENLILKNIRDLLVKAAKIRPIVFFIDDLHWADLTSIEFLESLYRLAESNRILFINVFRPRYPETSDRIWKKIRERHSDYYYEIYLEPLDERHCEILIDNLLNVKGLPSFIRELIIRKAEGNPFFIEEVARSFIDDGVVVMQDGRFWVTEKIDSVNIPETISEILMARLDKLDEGTRALLKTASVIGRSFFYKILTDVAAGIDEIDEKLEYLKDIQLVLERWRMEEIEYLFKHALVQEVTYESILLKKRKELHLKIADSIESIFSERLHEFYGLLALHYSRGEDLDKAEKYLIKAGEEALKAAASIEALNYYQEALKLYLKKHGDAGDPERIAYLEKNIAIALHNKGHMAEAVEHFDKALEHWGERRPKNKVTMLLNLVADLFSILRTLYFPSKKAKKIPPRGTSEIVDITHKRATALATVDNYRMFVDSIGLLRRLNKLDISRVPKGPSMYIQGCALFCFSGVSFKIGKKLLDYPKNYISSSDRKTFLDYKFAELMYGLLSGNWTREINYDESIVDEWLKIGDPYSGIVYLVWSGVLQIEQGNFDGAQKCVDKLGEIGEMFDNDYARARAYIVSSRRLLKCRRLFEAQCEVDEGISFSDRVGESLNLLNFLGVKANTQILTEDMLGAESSLKQAEENISRERRIFPWPLSSYCLSRFLYDVFKLEETIKAGEKANVNKCRKKACKNGKAALKNARKYAANRTEALKLMGVYYWLDGKQKKALEWWRKAVRTGYRLRARTELARTYLEIGKRLLEERSKFQKLNGIQADGYLKKAERLFRKMNLERDQRDLNKIKKVPVENGLDRYIVIQP